MTVDGRQRQFVDLADTCLWPALAGASEVSFLTRPRTHSDGHIPSLTKDR
jgi:hypothetical protein